MLKEIYKDDKRLMLYYDEYSKIEQMYIYKDFKHYNFSSWKPSKPILVTVSYAYDYKVKNSTLRKLLILKYKDYDKFLKLVKKLTTVSTKQL